MIEIKRIKRSQDTFKVNYMKELKKMKMPLWNYEIKIKVL